MTKTNKPGLIPRESLAGTSGLPATISTEQRELVRRTVFPNSTDDELALFIHDCQRQGVHPLDRLIHPQIRMNQNQRRYVAVTGIDLMRSRAADTGEHAGSDDPTFIEEDGKPYPLSATATVYRIVKGERCAFTATARWAEYYPGDGNVGIMWRRMPHGQLGKCAEALALRKAFPRTLAGLYAKEQEMDQVDGEFDEEQSAVLRSPTKTRNRIARGAAALADQADASLPEPSGAVVEEEPPDLDEDADQPAGPASASLDEFNGVCKRAANMLGAEMVKEAPKGSFKFYFVYAPIARKYGSVGMLVQEHGKAAQKPEVYGALVADMRAAMEAVAERTA